MTKRTTKTKRGLVAGLRTAIVAAAMLVTGAGAAMAAGEADRKSVV